jgi:hypothetical protein
MGCGLSEGWPVSAMYNNFSSGEKHIPLGLRKITCNYGNLAG